MLHIRACRIAVIGGLALLVSATPALGATATRSGGVITITGDPGLQPNAVGNHIRPVQQGADVVLQERSAPHAMVAGVGCTEIDQNAVSCGAASTATSLVFNLSDGDDVVDYDFNDPTLVSIPRTIDGGDGFDNLKGSLAADDIDGGDGSGFISGLAGADMLTGGAGGDDISPGCDAHPSSPEPSGGDCPADGADTVIGGGGDDQLSYWNTSAPVSVTLGAGGAQTSGNGAAGDGDLVSGIENVDGTREAANTINGNELHNRIDGSRFVDTISGGAGDDAIAPGTDFENAPLYFDANDVIDGGPGTDFVEYQRFTAVRIALPDPGAAPTTGNGGSTESDSIVNVEDMLAGDGDDTLTGNSVANGIDAGHGKDTVTAAAGDDVIYVEDDVADSVSCGDGNDNVTGDAGIDLIGADCETATDGETGNPIGGGNPGGGTAPGGGGTPPAGGGTPPGGGTPSGGGGTPAGGTSTLPFAGFVAFSSGLAGVNAFKAPATRSGRATVPPATFDAYGFTCAQACTGTTTGSLTALSAGKAQAAAKAKPLKLKAVKFSGGPGKPVRVKVKLPAKAVKLVKKRKRATLKLVTVVKSGGKSARLPATIRLKAKR